MGICEIIYLDSLWRKTFGMFWAKNDTPKRLFLTKSRHLFWDGGSSILEHLFFVPSLTYSLPRRPPPLAAVTNLHPGAPPFVTPPLWPLVNPRYGHESAQACPPSLRNYSFYNKPMNGRNKCLSPRYAEKVAAKEFDLCIRCTCMMVLTLESWGDPFGLKKILQLFLHLSSWSRSHGGKLLYVCLAGEPISYLSLWFVPFVLHPFGIGLKTRDSYMIVVVFSVHILLSCSILDKVDMLCSRSRLSLSENMSWPLKFQIDNAPIQHISLISVDGHSNQHTL